MWIDSLFPKLAAYKVISEPSDRYNCVAWAAGDNVRWWSNLPGYHWSTTSRSLLVESLVAVFEGIGYEVCHNTSVEVGYDKVALYARAGMWKHAARQLPTGAWTSKLGDGEDIEHSTPDALAGSQYGVVHCIMRRKQP
jgi:hypothetical protein